MWLVNKGYFAGFLTCVTFSPFNRSPIKHAQTGSHFFLCLWEKNTSDFRNYKIPVATMFGICPNLHTIVHEVQERTLALLPQTLAINRCPGSWEAAGLSQKSKSVYLESCCGLRIGQNQRWNENHAGKVTWLLCGCEDGDGTSLQCKTGRVAKCVGFHQCMDF